MIAPSPNAHPRPPSDPGRMGPTPDPRRVSYVPRSPPPRSKSQYDQSQKTSAFALGLSIVGLFFPTFSSPHARNPCRGGKPNHPPGKPRPALARCLPWRKTETVRRASRQDLLRAPGACRGGKRTIRRASRRVFLRCRPVPAVAENRRTMHPASRAGLVRCAPGACRSGKPNHPPGKPAGFQRCARCLLWRKTEPSTGQAGGIPALRRTVPAVAENRTIHRASRWDSCIAQHSACRSGKPNHPPGRQASRRDSCLGRRRGRSSDGHGARPQMRLCRRELGGSGGTRTFRRKKAFRAPNAEWKRKRIN